MNIDHIVAVYAFTDADKDQFVNILARSYLLAKIQAYQKASARTKHVVTIRKPWQPGESDVKHAREWATTQVDSIADTYETLLQHAIEQMLEEPHEAIGDVIGKVKDVVGKIGDWFKGFLPWKTQQIADQTWGTGANDGTEQFIEDVQGDDVEGDTSILRVMVIPAESSSDFCSNFSGRTFSLDDDVPDFPAHVNCIHSKEIIIMGDQDTTESVQSLPEIILFLDIDGVLSGVDLGADLEKIGDVWTRPIPNARTILQAIDQDSRFSPVWLSHWGQQSTAWNDYAGTQHWPVAFPLIDGDNNKAFALQCYLYTNYQDNSPLAIWVQDGFESADYVWAMHSGVKLLDTTEEPVRSLLLSDNVEDAIELIGLLVGSEVLI